MHENELFLIPSWADQFKDLKCGFTLPSVGNQALTRKSISSGRSTRENRLELARHLSISSSSFFSPHQIHSDIVIIVDEEKNCKGASSIDNAIEGDACITKEKEVLLIITWADCIPVILYDPITGWIGAVHSGWKSSVKNIAGKAINLFIKNGVHPSDVYAAIGPGIRDCCYQVDDEFKKQFSKSGLMDFFREEEDQIYFDLSGAVYRQLLNLGLDKGKIDFYGKCTCCSKTPSFFSFRKDGKDFEGQAAFIGRFKD